MKLNQFALYSAKLLSIAGVAILLKYFNARESRGYSYTHIKVYRTMQ